MNDGTGTVAHDRGGAAVYTNAFYAEIDPGARHTAGIVAPLLATWITPRSVVDVGCGRGAWLAAFAAAGSERVLGLDGSHVPRDRLAIAADDFLVADLTAPPTLDETFDLAVSLEVAEHLAPRHAGAFVAFLASLAPVVLFSAAAPGQGGVDHVNEQWPAYWAERFATHGFRPVDVLRPRLWNDAETPYYYAQNTVLYVSDDRLDHVDGALPLSVAQGASAPLALVHPAAPALRPPAPPAPPSFRSLLRALPGAAARAARRSMASRSRRTGR